VAIFLVILNKVEVFRVSREIYLSGGVISSDMVMSSNWF